MNHNLFCTKCGKELHHKQQFFDRDYKLQKYSGLVKEAESYTLKLCQECLNNLAIQLIDSLVECDFNRFVERNGWEKSAYDKELKTRKVSHARGTKNRFTLQSKQVVC